MQYWAWLKKKIDQKDIKPGVLQENMFRRSHEDGLVANVIFDGLCPFAPCEDSEQSHEAQ